MHKKTDFLASKIRAEEHQALNSDQHPPDRQAAIVQYIIYTGCVSGSGSLPYFASQ